MEFDLPMRCVQHLYDVCLLDEIKSLKSKQVIEVAKKYFDKEAFVSVNILPSGD